MKRAGRVLSVVLFFAIGISVSLAQKIETPSTKGFKTTVALVTDSDTRSKVTDELLLYKQLLESRGLGVYIVAHDWTKPEEIRDVLKQLYSNKAKLEGAVLIGDIPIPMIRDAQHLTSTFKMDQRIDWRRSSVPSDRFYDDFDLQFNFLKQDTLYKNYFYYSLSSASPQQITMDIYTARIKPPVEEGKDKYDQLRAYLKKVATAGKESNPINNLMVFTGHGYNSESLNAWAGEQLALIDQLPQLFSTGSMPKFMNFRMDNYMKYNLLSEVQREDLDIAIFHGHGDEETQLINGYPYVSAPNPSIDNLKRYLRSKIQAAHRKKQDVAETKKRFSESLGVPLAWMEDALVDSVMKADSLFELNINISMQDVKGITPNARMIVMDACDNGEFHKDEYIAGYYAFGKGKTMTVLANSVGVLQDQWPNEMLGLLQHGVRTGNWFRHVAYLETHIFGDPTYAFGSDEKYNLNLKIVNDTKNIAVWNKLLKVDDADIQSLALACITDIQGQAASGLLRSMYFQSPHPTTRLEALKKLNTLNNADYIAVLKESVNDPYELIRRLSVSMIGDSGSDELVPALVHVTINDRHSKRVSYRAKTVLGFMNSAKVEEEINRQVPLLTYRIDADAIKTELLKSQVYAKRKVEEDFIALAGLPAKEKLFNIRTLRAYAYHEAIPPVIAVAANVKEEEKVRLAAVEALGWFNRSHYREQVISACEKIMRDKASSADLKDQAAKTIKIMSF